MKRLVPVKKINLSKPSHFTVRTKSNASVNKERKTAKEISDSLNHYTTQWLSGDLSSSDYFALKKDLLAKQERLLGSNFVKTFNEIAKDSDSLRLFSKYIQKHYSRTEDSLIQDESLSIARDRQINDTPAVDNLDPYLNSSYHRMTTKYIKGIDPKIQAYKLREYRNKDNSNEYKFWEEYTEKIGEPGASARFKEEKEKADLAAKRYHDLIDSEAGKIRNLTELESELRDSGYDDKYSSKLTERMVQRRLDPSEAAKVIEKRKNRSEEFFEKDLEKESNKFRNFRRKLSDGFLVARISGDSERKKRRNKNI